MNSKKRTLLCCIFIVIMMICSPLLVSYFSLPNKIQVFVGKEHQMDFDIPLKAKLFYGESLQLKVKDVLLNEGHSIKLSEPISFKMDEEGDAKVKVSVLGVIPLKTVSVHSTQYKEVVPGGKIIGVKINTNGVLVLGVGGLEIDGKMVSPCKELIKEGDLIQFANGTFLNTKEDLKDIIEASGKETIKLSVLRDGRVLEFDVSPQYSPQDDAYKIGVWIRDSTQGIGTLTYYDPSTHIFGALGHGITDVDTKTLMPIRSGIISTATVSGIKKGEKGDPGELSGVVEIDHEVGDVQCNTPIGIYGKLNDEGQQLIRGKAIPIAFQDEVHEGKATILVALAEQKIESYDVYIQKVSKYSTEPSKGMVIKIVDKRLIDLTNGIVQGMSGSPIIQDNKLVGAITHVFVQDSTKGYGIFIENMINFENNN